MASQFLWFSAAAFLMGFIGLAGVLVPQDVIWGDHAPVCEPGSDTAQDTNMM